MKYWTLSLKLEALMQREQQISNSRRTVIKVIYFVLEVTTLCGATLELVYPFRYWNHSITTRDLLWIGFSMLLFVSFASLVFVSDGFRRLNGLLDHNNLGISRKQVLLHISSFVLSSIAVGFLMFLFASGGHNTQLFLSNEKLRKFVDVRIYAAASCIFLIALATCPIIYTVNSLLDQSIRNNKEQQAMKNEFQLIRSIESLNEDFDSYS